MWECLMLLCVRLKLISQENQGCRLQILCSSQQLCIVLISLTVNTLILFLVTLLALVFIRPKQAMYFSVH